MWEDCTISHRTLHFGSLVAAVASYLDAKKHHGQWLLRIEDLDPPRESKSAPAEIMSQLRAFGLFWDGDVMFQSARLNAYEENLGKLRNQGLVYPCICSRKSIVGVYPGTCRNRSFEATEFLLRKDCEQRAVKSNSRTWFSVPGNVMLSRTLATL